jgi:antitoxin component YwqK of YwqJK toxin-antitoxin module
MKTIPPFRSSIPKSAQERVVSWHPNGTKSGAEYLVDGKVVGARWFDAEGNLLDDRGFRDGKKHGTAYRIEVPGHVTSATPYSNGVEHGVARQWSHDGRLLGTYRMNHGTGIDLWWDDGTCCHGTSCKPGGRRLAEVHFMRCGQHHGYEWWINDDQASVHEERHWQDGQLHGIERDWNLQGRLRRGFPRYFVAGQQVTRRQYVKAAAEDSSLPPFRMEDNLPQRRFPPVIAEHLGAVG